MTPASSAAPSLADRVDGLTKHTKRFVIFFGVALIIAGANDALSGRARVLPEWPSLLSIAVALVWALAATDDFRGGTHNRIPKRIEGEGVRHPIGWYRAFLTRVVLPNRTFFGWLIPGSMYPIALSYLSGILVPLAAIGALFLLASMFLFLNLNVRHPRDDYVMLTVTQLIILVTNPRGVPTILRALEVIG